MDIAIIGGGAAGFFAAINLKKMSPHANITIYEAGVKPLAKVAVTGGGRCNLTNSFEGCKTLSSIYPRGYRLMNKLFKTFDNNDTFKWFENAGIRLITQDDNCVFPKSQDAMEIVGKFHRLCIDNDIKIETRHKVTNIETIGNKYTLTFSNGQQKQESADIVVITTGGSPICGLPQMLCNYDIPSTDTVPSLFTFNINDVSLNSLTGIVVDDVSVFLPGTKFKTSGALLITHNGLSGPSILKISSLAARFLAELDYKTRISINWTGNLNGNDVEQIISQNINCFKQRQLSSVRICNLTSRLWLHLLDRAGLPQTKMWSELSKKGINKLINTLINDEYEIDGRNMFKEEFVTCGGISLDAINHDTLESKSYPGMYFAGEVLDIDAITGGFNLQAAWTTGYVVALAISKKIN